MHHVGTEGALAVVFIERTPRSSICADAHLNTAKACAMRHTLESGKTPLPPPAAPDVRSIFCFQKIMGSFPPCVGAVLTDRKQFFA